MSRCWKCGHDEGTAHFNGLNCPIGNVIKVGCWVPEVTIALEKIEPLDMDYLKILDIAEKLNEVIENQNKIIDYLNGMVKK